MTLQKSYPTIWEVSDDLWEIVKILLDKFDHLQVVHEMTDDQFSMQSFIDSVLVANGIVPVGQKAYF